ncbi:MAG: flavin reductase family protein, partial [Oribacterium sp.]|nr:flavin reductase family protein [Oribacterium sp.]
VLPLGSHDMFLAEVVAVRVDEQFIDEKGAFHMDRVGLVAYSHGDYMSLGEKLGSFGYSVRKKPLPTKKKPEKKQVKKSTFAKVKATENPAGRSNSTKKTSGKKPSNKKRNS